MKRRFALIFIIVVLCSIACLVVTGCNDAPQGTLFIRYSSSADGSNFTEEWSEGQDYIGFAYAEQAPGEKEGYSWALFRGEKGDKGADGKDGTNGKDGVSSNIYIRYSSSADGSNFTETWSEGQRYIGIAVGSSAPVSSAGYVWSLFVGESEMPEKNDKSIKILAIGNSFSDDATEFLWDIYKDGGYEDVVIGKLYIGGCSLDTHWSNMSSNFPAYLYSKKTAGAWVDNQNTSVLTALTDEEWDIITLQQASGSSGIASTYQNLGNIIAYVNLNKTNTDAKIYWHATWAYQGDSDHGDFPSYGSNQITMYNAINSAVSSEVLTKGEITGVIPCGTAVQNLRTSYLGDTLTRDGYHLSYDIGRYTAALTWYAKLSGKAVDDVDFLPQNSTYAYNISENLAAIKEAVASAVATPYSVTSSQFTEKQDPSLAGLRRLTISWNRSYYNSTNPTGIGAQVIEQSSLSNKFWCTEIFDKADLPNGSVIIVASGWQYRPEGWVNGQANQSSARPANVTTEKITISDGWWASFNERAFNLSKVAQTDISGYNEAQINEIFQIWVPEE